MTAPEVPTVTKLEVLPMFGQSEMRPKPDLALADALRAMHGHVLDEALVYGTYTLHACCPQQRPSGRDHGHGIAREGFPQD